MELPCISFCELWKRLDRVNEVGAAEGHAGRLWGHPVCGSDRLASSGPPGRRAQLLCEYICPDSRSASGFPDRPNCLGGLEHLLETRELDLVIKRGKINLKKVQKAKSLSYREKKDKGC